MDIERGRIVNDFIEPNKKQYVIPVYQRNYEWSREQCVKLFEDIVQAYKKKPYLHMSANNRPNHQIFCGNSPCISAKLRIEMLNSAEYQSSPAYPSVDL